MYVMKKHTLLLNLILTMSILVSILGLALLIFVHFCWINPNNMERLIIPYKNHELVVNVSSQTCEYHFDTRILKDESLDGVLIMKDGKTFDVKYDIMYNSFLVDGRYGFYTLDSS